MEIPKFESYAVVSNLFARPHAIRMMCALQRLLLHGTSDWRDEFFSALNEIASTTSMQKYMTGWPLKKFTPVLMKKGMVDWELASNKKLLMEIARAHEIREYSNGIQLIDLASPAIGEKTLRTLYAAEKTSRLARSVMSINKNFPADLPPVSVPHELADIAIVQAKYGNLNDPNVKKNIGEFIFRGGKNNWRADLGIQFLCCRQDLPEEMAAPVDRKAGFTDYKSLSNIPAHREYVKKGRASKVGLSSWRRSDWIRFSPEMKTETLETIFEELQSSGVKDLMADWRTDSARCAVHPNSSPKIRQAAVESSEISGELYHNLIETQSPHAEEMLLALKANPIYFAQIKACTSQTLGDIFRACKSDKESGARGNKPEAAFYDEALHLASHPNFPWGEFGYYEIMSMAGAKTGMQMQCIMCASAAPYPELDNIHTSPEPAAILFRENLSSRKLDILAKRYPEQRALFACHPNATLTGGGKSSPIIDSSFTFPLPALAGKGGPKQKAAGSVLEI